MKKETVLIRNDEDSIIELEARIDNLGYITIVGDEYELGYVDEWEKRSIIKEFLADVLEVDTFINNSDMSFEDFVENYMDNDDYFIDEVIRDVYDYWYAEGKLYYWENTGGGQLSLYWYSEDFEDLEEVWKKHHLKEDNLEERFNEIVEVFNKYRDLVDQERPF